MGYFLQLLLLLIPCVFAQYNPGQYYSWNQYLDWLNTDIEIGTKKAYSHNIELNKNLGKELKAALYEILSSKNTIFFYADFTNPKHRKEGKFVDSNRDDGTGLRLISQLEINGKLLSSIAFLDFNLDTHQIEFSKGPDNIRIMAELEKADSKYLAKHGGLSFDLEIRNNKAYSFKPALYYDINGNTVFPKGISDITLPEHCFACHRNVRNRLNSVYQEIRKMNQIQRMKYYLQQEGVTDFINYVTGLTENPQVLKKIKQSLVTPKNLWPQNLKKILRSD